GAGLVARNAIARGLKVKPWVKTSLAPGSQVVTDYLAKAGLDKPLDKLGFQLVGYGGKNEPVYLKDIWPSPKEIADTIRKSVKASSFKKRYGNVFEGGPNWKKVKVTKGQTYQW